MPKGPVRSPASDAVRRAFARLTATLEDAALIACRGQSVSDQKSARRCTDKLIADLEHILKQARRLRKRLQ